MKINVVNHAEIKISKLTVQTIVKKILLQFKKQKLRNKSDLKKELTIAFVDVKMAKKLNLYFRKKKYATDVLSFAGESDELGELILCSKVIAKQAKEHDLKFTQELCYLLIHGILHLLGYDHEKSKKEEKLMFSIQDKVFAQLRE